MSSKEFLNTQNLMNPLKFMFLQGLYYKMREYLAIA